MNDAAAAANESSADHPNLPPSTVASPSTMSTGTTSNSAGTTKRKLFLQNNTVRKDSIIEKTSKIGITGNVIHPSKLPQFQKFLNQTNLRRIPEDYLENFEGKMRDFLLDRSRMVCFNQRQSRDTQCTCLKDFLNVNDDIVNISSVIVSSHYNHSLHRRDMILCSKVHSLMDARMKPGKESTVNMKLRGKIFVIGGKFDGSLYSTYSLCVHGYLALYGIGTYHYNSLKGRYVDNIQHGLTGVASNNGTKEEILQSMREYFEELADEGEDYASRQVRTRLGGVYLRDKELDYVRLPPSYSKRLVYDRWVYKNGWIVGKATSDGGSGSVKKYRVRPNDDLEWPEGSERHSVVCRATFMKYWKEEFKHIQIGSPSKDTCGDCWEYKRAVLSNDRSRKRLVDDEDDDIELAYDSQCPAAGLERTAEDDLHDDNLIAFTLESDKPTNIVTPMPKVVPVNHINSSITSYPKSSSCSSSGTLVCLPTSDTQVPSEPSVQGLSSDDLFEDELNILNWKEHVDAFRAQREYVNKLAAEAKLHATQNIPWPTRKYAYCSDYCQNMDIPHFGSEQPGETYYYSPLNISCFGCVDFATDKLDAFVYTEAEGRKGGNNVASLLFKKLTDDGIMSLAKEKGPGAQLSLVFDNCAGQNKNRMVLRFAQYLVDTHIFKRVEVIFLVMGHTKNICDRRFKDLKKTFHHRNVYTFRRLIEILSKNNEQYVDVIPVTHQDFFNWDLFLNDKQYKRAIKDVSKFHCFYYDTDYNGVIVKQYTVNKSETVKELIVKALKKIVQMMKYWNGGIH